MYIYIYIYIYIPVPISYQTHSDDLLFVFLLLVLFIDCYLAVSTKSVACNENYSCLRVVRALLCAAERVRVEQCEYALTMEPFLKRLVPSQARQAYPRLSSNAPFLKKIFGNPTRHFLMVGFFNARQCRTTLS